MKVDNGNAPCAFDNLKQVIEVDEKNADQFDNDLLTLSTCGSSFRHLMSEGEWVFGIAANKFGEKSDKLIWVGKVERITSKSRYFKEKDKKLAYNKQSRPDNYYALKEDVKAEEKVLKYIKGKDIQGLKKYAIFDNPYHDVSQKNRDLYDSRYYNVPRAITLWFDEWWYFGKNAIEIDENLINKYRGGMKLNDKDVQNFVNKIRKQFPNGGIYGSPMSIDMPKEVKKEENEDNQSCGCSKNTDEFTGGSWREYLKWWYDNKFD